MRHPVESSFLQNGLNLFPFLRGAAFERVNHGHGRLALPQVAGHRLSQNVFRSRKIQNVVHDLKCHPQIVPVFSQSALLLRARAAENRSQSHAHREQAGRLAKN